MSEASETRRKYQNMLTRIGVITGTDPVVPIKRPVDIHAGTHVPLNLVDDRYVNGLNKIMTNPIHPPAKLKKDY